MIRIENRCARLAAAALIALWLPLAAQTVRQITPTAPPPPKTITPKPQAGPFFPEPADAGGQPIQFRGPDRMTELDRALEATAEPAIAERARRQGLEFNQGHWSYRQIVCAAFPNHLFLRFTRDQGRGNVSVFSAAIPRSGEGRVEVIPILRRSYSPFSPAPVNPLTIAAFNQIRAEEKQPQAPAWLGVGLCYAALAGANPQVPRVDRWGGQPRSYPALSASLSLSLPAGGGAVMRITDTSAARRPMRWTLLFDAKGKLLKAEHAPAPLLTATEYHPKRPPEPLQDGQGAATQPH